MRQYTFIFLAVVLATAGSASAVEIPIEYRVHIFQGTMGADFSLSSTAFTAAKQHNAMVISRQSYFEIHMTSQYTTGGQTASIGAYVNGTGIPGCGWNAANNGVTDGSSVKSQSWTMICRNSTAVNEGPHAFSITRDSGALTGTSSLTIQLIQIDRIEIGNLSGNGANMTEITTAFDVWIPVVILGGLAIWFFTRVPTAYLPAVASILALMSFLIGVPAFNMTGAVAIVVIATSAHVVRNWYARKERNGHANGE